MTTAVLGFEIRSEQAEKASANLDRLTAASRKAQSATTGLSSRSSMAASSARNLGSATAAATIRTNAHSAAVRTNSTALQANASATRMARLQTRNLAFQFQDIGTMLVAGQSPFMLLSQQLPQVTMYGGQLTGVMSALKGTIAGLFSPLGLLTVGFVAAGAAAMRYFTAADDEADKVADALAEQETLIRKVADVWGDAIPAIREYANELDQLRDKSELFKGVQELTNRAWEQARQILPDLKTEIGGIVSQMIRAGESSAQMNRLRDAFNEADRAAQDLRTAISEGRQTTEDFDRVTNALAELLANDAVRGSNALRDAINDLRDAYGEAADEAVRLGKETARALATAAAQEANRNRFDKTGSRVKPGATPLSEADFYGRFGAKNIFGEERDLMAPQRVGGTGLRTAANGVGVSRFGGDMNADDIADFTEHSADTLDRLRSDMPGHFDGLERSLDGLGASFNSSFQSVNSLLERGFQVHYDSIAAAVRTGIVSGMDQGGDRKQYSISVSNSFDMLEGMAQRGIDELDQKIARLRVLASTVGSLASQAISSQIAALEMQKFDTQAKIDQSNSAFDIFKPPSIVYAGKFADGGSFVVPGSTSGDRNRVMLDANGGERVTVTKDGGGGGDTYNLTYNAPAGEDPMTARQNARAMMDFLRRETARA